MHDAAWGRDDRPVVTESEPVSMSRETTFERDLHAVRDREELGAIFTDLCTRVAEDLQRKGYVGRTIGIKLRYDDFRTATRDQTLEHFTADAATIRRAAGQCLKRVDLGPRLRLLGVRVGKLGRADALPAGPVAPQPAQPIAGRADAGPFPRCPGGPGCRLTPARPRDRWTGAYAELTVGPRLPFSRERLPEERSWTWKPCSASSSGT